MHSSQSLCRLCAKSFELSSLLHIFNNDSKAGTGSLDTLVKRYLPFPVSASDSLTHYICKLCCAHVIRWHRFLTLCIKAQNQLKNIEQKAFKAPIQGNLVDTEVKEIPANVLRVENKSPLTNDNAESSTCAEQPVLVNKTKRKKSNYCIARWCNNNNEMGIPFFRVPKDQNRALQWLSAADRMDLADKDAAYLYRCYLCATHFTKEMFTNETGRSLNRNAVPSVFSKPAYALKIEKALSYSNSYPKELQGVRLKSILPKSMQPSQGIPIQGSLSIPHAAKSYAQIITVVPESQQKLENPLQDVLFVGDGVPSHSNIEIISMSPLKDDASETVQILDVQDSKGLEGEPPQNLSMVPNSEPILSRNVNEVYENTVKEIHSQGELLNDSTCVCDFIKSDRNHVCGKEIDINQSHCKYNVTDSENGQSSVSASQNTLMDFTADYDNVTMLGLHQNPASVNDKETILENNLVDQHITTDSLGFHVLPLEDSLTSNIAIASFSPGNPPFLSQDAMDFQSKDLVDKDVSSHGLGNIVGSQDFLLMHSSSNHIEQDRDHGLRQDKNLNNLCGTVVPEPVPGTAAVYGERSIMGEASVRTIECTSPSHGQIIEGLFDLDQFLESG